MPVWLRLIVLFLCGLSLVSFAASGPLGSHNNPLRFAIVPSGHGATALGKAKPFISCLEKESGYFITLQVPNSYIAVTEAMGSQKIDLAFGDISSYLIARKKYNVDPILQVKRYGTTVYNSMIIVRADSDIKSIADLDGKKFAYPDASSASGYLFPVIEMKKQNLKFAQEMPTGSMEASVTALLQKKVDAAAAYYNPPDSKTNHIRDARERLLKIYPDIEKQTKIVWISKSIPNEPVFVRSELAQDIKEMLQNSIPKCIEQYPQSINNMDSLIPVQKDYNAYDEYIETLENSGLEIVKVFSQK